MKSKASIKAEDLNALNKKRNGYHNLAEKKIVIDILSSIIFLIGVKYLSYWAF